MSDKNTSVLQEWVTNQCSWKEQTGLISAIRGMDSDTMDGIPLYVVEEAKNITKMIRYLVLNNADNKTGFMSNKIVSSTTIVKTLSYDVCGDVLSKHWVGHILMAFKTISLKHPNIYTKKYYKDVLDEIATHIMMVDSENNKKDIDTTVSKNETSKDHKVATEKDKPLDVVEFKGCDNLDDKTDDCLPEKINNKPVAKCDDSENLDNYTAPKLKDSFIGISASLIGNIIDLNKILVKTCLLPDSADYINIEKLNIALVQSSENGINEWSKNTIHTFLKRDIFKSSDSISNTIKYSLAIYNIDSNECLWVSNTKEYTNAINQCIDIIRTYDDKKYLSLINKIHDVVLYWKYEPATECI